MPLLTASAPSIYTQIQGMTLQAFTFTLNAWVAAMTKIWKAAHPQAEISVMGTDAKNNFLISSTTATYLLTVSELAFSPADHAKNAARIAAAAALAQPYTVNADGTITVNPAPAVTPA